MMESQWPTKRNDIRKAKHIIKKHPFKVIPASNTKLYQQTELDELYPWVPKLIETFKKLHNSGMWFRIMLRSLDEATSEYFINEEDRVKTVETIFVCLRHHLESYGLEFSFA